MTGAELRAWRERLGKDDAWGAALLESLPGAPASAEIGCGPGQGGVRLHAAESVAFGYAYHAFLRKTLRAALEAEEARQSAERGPVEPVCPEGVTTWLVMGTTGRTCVALSRLHNPVVVVEPDGCVISSAFDKAPASPALLEYAAALSRYRAAQHAASDRQRKLDAVRAAEEAHDAAHKATEDAYAAYREAEAAVGRTHSALKAARREAGL